MTPHPSPHSGRFPDFIQGVYEAIGLHLRLVPAWLCMYMSVRVDRVRKRLLNLLVQLRAGTNRAPRPRARKPAAAPRPPNSWVPALVVPYLPEGAKPPSGFGWMNRLLHDNSRSYSGPASAGFLHAILTQDPEIQAFARACPALARQLRGLCHMLGVKPPEYLKRPARERTPRDVAPPSQAPVRPIPPPPEPVPPPQPLPRGIATSFEPPEISPTLSRVGLKNWTPTR